MSFTRNLYDNCAYKTFLSGNKSTENYTLYPGKYYNDNQCRVQKGLVGGNNVSLSMTNLVDLESDLKGQSHKLSDCPSCKYNPRKNKFNNSRFEHLPSCNIIDYNKVVLPDNVPTFRFNFPFN